MLIVTLVEFTKGLFVYKNLYFNYFLFQFLSAENLSFLNGGVNGDYIICKYILIKYYNL